MRILTPLVAASLLAGCAAQPAPAPTPAPAAAVAPPAAAGAATGLAFDPPITAQAPAPDLSRDARSPAAVSGVDVTSTSKFDVSTYLRDTTDDGGYDQESVTERTGTVHH